MRREAEDQQDRERHQQPEGVCVAERLGQPRIAQGVVRAADVTREEPRTECVERHEHSTRNDAAQESAPWPRATRGAGASLPQPRRRGFHAPPPAPAAAAPGDHKDESAAHTASAARPPRNASSSLPGQSRVRDENDGGRDQREAEGREPPFAREVAAVGRRECGHGNESGDERRRRTCRPRQECGVRARESKRRAARRARPTCRVARARCSRRSACRRSESAGRSSRR